MPQTSYANDCHTLAGLRPGGPIRAHGRKASTEDGRGRFPSQAIREQCAALRLSDHVLCVGASVCDPGLRLCAKFWLFLPAVFTVAAARLKPGDSDAISGL